MKTEYELRFYPIHKEIVRQAFRDSSAELTTPEHLMKRKVYQIRDSSFIRVRESNGKVEITGKIIKNSATIDGTLETNIDVAHTSFNEITALFDKLFDNGCYQESLREEWLLYKDASGNTVVATIDTWPGLEPLVEIEGNNESIIHHAISLQNHEFGKPFHGDILQLYKHVYGLSSSDFHSIKNLSFDNTEQLRGFGNCSR